MSALVASSAVTRAETVNNGQSNVYSSYIAPRLDIYDQGNSATTTVPGAASTTVTMTSGAAAGSVFVHNTSALNVQSGVTIDNGVRSYHSSFVNVRGGDIGPSEARDTSTFIVDGGTLTNLQAFDASSVAVYRGTIGSLSVNASAHGVILGGNIARLDTGSYNIPGRSTLELWGGQVSEFFIQRGTVEMHGGSIADTTFVSKGGLLNLSGGEIGSALTASGDASTTGPQVNLFGGGFKLDGVSLGSGGIAPNASGRLTGTLLDGTMIDTDYTSLADGYATIHQAETAFPIFSASEPSPALDIAHDVKGPSSAVAVDSLTLDDGARLTLQSAGTITATNGIEIAAGAELAGNGTLVGDVENGGDVGPGNSPGAITVDGDFTQLSSGSLLMEIATEALYDQLIVTGMATLDGALLVDLTPADPPAPGAVFNLVTADKISLLDTFAFTAPAGWRYDVLGAAGAGQTLQVWLDEPGSVSPIPLPPAAWSGMALFGAMGLNRLRRWKAAVS